MSLEDFEPAFFDVEQLGDAVVARFVNERLTDELNVERMGDELFSLTEQFQFKQVIVDMSKVVHMTSSSLGKLITMHRRLHRSQGRMVLCNLTEAVEDVLETSRLIDYFNVSNSIDDAQQAAGAPVDP